MVSKRHNPNRLRDEDKRFEQRLKVGKKGVGLVSEEIIQREEEDMEVMVMVVELI